MSWSGRRADARTAALAVLAGGALFLVCWAILHVDRLEPYQLIDTGVYQRYGDAMAAGQVPYRDFELEYPPGALPVFLLPSLAPEASYRDVFEPIMAALGVILVGLLVLALWYAGAGRDRLLAAAAFAGVAPLALGTVILTRFDLWPAVLLAGALAALAADRPRLGLALLGVAVSAKLYPLVVLPLALAHVWHRHGRRACAAAAAAFLAALLAIVVPFLALSADGVLDALRRQTDRPLQIESTGAAVLHALHGLGVYEPTVESGFGSQNLVGRAPDAVASVTTAVQLVAIIGVWVSYALLARRSRPGAQGLLVASAAAVAAFVAFGKVLSPQFMVWLFALVPVVAGRRGLVAGALGLGAFAVTHAWFPRQYWALVDLEIGPAWLVVVRDASLVALVVVLATAIPRAMERERGPARSA